MAAAAKHTIVQVSEIVPTGSLDPENVVTPGIYVNSVVRVERHRRRTGGLTMSTQTSIKTSEKPLGRDELAQLVARDIIPGSFVNLGIGQPTLVSNYLAEEQNITLHTENGMLGMGPAAEGDEIDGDLINAGKIPVTAARGLVLPPRRLVRDHARRAPGHLRARRLPGLRHRRPRQLAHRRPGRDPRRRRRDGPGHRAPRTSS